MRVRKDWWKGFFNEIYLLTDARSVCNSRLTRRETDLLEEVLGLDKNEKILDFCGGHGRHSLELARRGYRDLTVLDFSKYLINLGRGAARDKGFGVKFVCADARFSGLGEKSYSAIFVMANSFGYCMDEKEDLRILKEVYRLLKKGGRLLLDLTDLDYVRDTLSTISWHEANDDVIVCRKRQLKGEIVKTREVVISKSEGLLRDACYCERLYNKSKAACLLKMAGFKSLSAKKSLSLHRDKKDYGFLTSRMVITAEK